VGAVTVLVLALNANRQIYDSNFVFAWEGTSLLAGDRLYRDLFEWGAPLSAYLSAGAQLVLGHRLLGEFLLQWLFIGAGVGVAFHLGCRLADSVAATCATLPLIWFIAADTPPYHYSKLFVFPVAVWVAWRHVERPSRWTSAWLGIATAVAFLFRHDYLFYVAPAGALALVLARAPTTRERLALAARDALVCSAAALVCVAPWLFVVQSSEGLLNYTRLRTAKYEYAESVYRALLVIHPVRELSAERVEPKVGVVGFVWRDEVPEARQREFEARLGLRRLDRRDAQGRLQYQVSNLYDPRLLELDSYVSDGNGFEYERLTDIRDGLPPHDTVALWLMQATLLVPLLLLGAAIAGAGLALLTGGSVPIDSWLMAVAAVVLTLADLTLLRERSYIVAVAPLTATLSARFIAAPRHRSAGGVARLWVATRRLAGWAMLILTTYAAAVWARQAPIFKPMQLPNTVAAATKILVASPPTPVYEDGVYQYFRECTKPGDHLLVLGPTAFDINYVTGRPAAGGHLYWRSLWGTDPLTQARSLDLLRRQSVPFAIAANGAHVLGDLLPYPRIHDYMTANYRELDGFNHAVMVDARRQPTGTFGAQRLPCFR
jgi:hypothetical protein